MRSYALAVLMLGALAGCNYEIVEKHPFKWGMVDKTKLQASIHDAFKAENPYPKELALPDNYGRERGNISTQVYELENAGRERCKELYLTKEQAEKQNTPAIIPRARLQLSSGDYAPMEMPRAPARSSTLPQIYSHNSDPGFQPSANYQRCVSDIKNDQLIGDLKAKIQKYDDLQEQRRKFDLDVTKKENEYVDKLIAEFAAANGFSLIINANQNALIYNKEQGALDITVTTIKYALDISRSKQISSNANPLDK